MNNDRNIKENDGGSIGSTLREMRTFLLLWLTPVSYTHLRAHETF